MKTFIKKSISVFVLLFSLVAYSNEEISVTLNEGGEVTNLFLENVEQGSKLQIKDVLGLVLYKEVILGSGDYTKGFDLTNLPNGFYFFELESELKIVEIPFSVHANKVSFEKEEKEVIYKPIVEVKGNMVYVSRTSFSLATLNLQMYFTENTDLVFSEKFENKHYVQRIYDFSNAEKGTYTLVFRSEGREFVKKIEI